MAKTASCRKAPVSARGLSPAGELKVIKKIAALVKSDPDKVRALTVAAGIQTANGRLRKAYGGKA
jgi:hypothetical protein